MQVMQCDTDCSINPNLQPLLKMKMVESSIQFVSVAAQRISVSITHHLTEPQAASKSKTRPGEVIKSPPGQTRRASTHFTRPMLARSQPSNKVKAEAKAPSARLRTHPKSDRCSDNANHQERTPHPNLDACYYCTHSMETLLTRHRQLHDLDTVVN